MSKSQPLGEVFGFPPENQSTEACRHRKLKLCPFNNYTANCTKDKVNDPLGVCSVRTGSDGVTVTCPVRFREGWLIAEHAADFFFPPDKPWVSLSEVRLKDQEGKSAGNIDHVLVSYNQRGRVDDFGSLEVQAVYISGNVRSPFQAFMDNQTSKFEWSGQANYPTPDYLSSSRKRLAPQLLFKGGILRAWGKKMAVALDKRFFHTLPSLESVSKADGEIAWLVYELVHDANNNRFQLTLADTKYTRFEESLLKITKPIPGSMEDFVATLQNKLDEKLSSGPDVEAPSAIF